MYGLRLTVLNRKEYWPENRDHSSIFRDLGTTTVDLNDDRQSDPGTTKLPTCKNYKDIVSEQYVLNLIYVPSLFYYLSHEHQFLEIKVRNNPTNSLRFTTANSVTGHRIPS